MRFIIDDERHAERQGEYQDFDQDFAELKRRAKIPWDQPPNVAPCAGWRGCEVRRTLVLEVSASGVKWAIATTDISNRLH